MYSAYQNNDITEFEKILKTNHSNIMDDPFIREHIEGESDLLIVLHRTKICMEAYVIKKALLLSFRAVTEHKNTSAHQIN